MVTQTPKKLTKSTNKKIVFTKIMLTNLKVFKFQKLIS